jgi:ABC-type multidrug transport system fused ATPase/permease subunit
MSKLTYNFVAVKHCIKKIAGFCMLKRNILIPILIGPILYLLTVANDLKIKSVDTLAFLIERKKDVTISDYCILFLKSNILKIALIATLDILSTRLYATTQKASLSDYINLEWCIFRKYTIGDLALRQFEKGESVSVLLYTLFPYVFESSAYLIQTLHKISQKSDKNVFYLLIGSLIVHIASLTLLAKRFNYLQKEYTLSKVKLSSTVSNEVTNFDIIKTYNLEKVSVDKIARLNENRKSAKMNLSMFVGKTDVYFKVIEISILCGLFYLNGSGIVNIPNIYNVSIHTVELHKSLRMLIKNLIACNENFVTYYTLESDIVPVRERNVVLQGFESIEFRDVNFANVFSNLTGTIYQGEKIAVVGRNSSGKSLLFKYLSGFIETSKGQILINHTDIEEITRKSLRSIMTLVSQNESYTMGTVMQNLRYGNQLSESQIIEECKKFNVHSIFSSLDNGYQKTSSSGGLELSGGQRQRVNVMRGILRDTPVLLLDDCLSSINTSCQNDLVKLITDIKKRTIIMAIKNQEHLEMFDRIIFLNGENSSIGTYEQLKGPLIQYFNN